MSSRIIISVLLGLVGTLGTGAAALNPAQKKSAFQPGAATAVSAAKIVKPASATKWKRTKTWSNARVQTIAPAAQSPASVEVNGFTFHHAQQATSATVSTAAQPAGGNR